MSTKSLTPVHRTLSYTHLHTEHANSITIWMCSQSLYQVKLLLKPKVTLSQRKLFVLPAIKMLSFFLSSTSLMSFTFSINIESSISSTVCAFHYHSKKGSFSVWNNTSKCPCFFLWICSTWHTLCEIIKYPLGVFREMKVKSKHESGWGGKSERWVSYVRQRVQYWQPNSPSRMNSASILTPHMAAIFCQCSLYSLLWTCD